MLGCARAREAAAGRGWGRGAVDEAEAPVEGVAPAGPDGGDGPAAFGARLRRHRLAAGLTQEALAERAGLSARGLQELERGARRPLPDTVGRLAGALALPPEAHAAFAAAAPRPRAAPGALPAGSRHTGRPRCRCR